MTKIKCDAEADCTEFPHQVKCTKKGDHKGFLWCLGSIDTDDKKITHLNCGGFKRQHKVPQNWCRWHYLEYMFGITAFECPDCFKEQRDATDVELYEEDTYTYVPVERIYAPKNGTWGLDMLLPAYEIKCWFCGKVLLERQKSGEQEIV